MKALEPKKFVHCCSGIIHETIKNGMMTTYRSLDVLPIKSGYFVRLFETHNFKMVGAPLITGPGSSSSESSIFFIPETDLEKIKDMFFVKKEE